MKIVATIFDCIALFCAFWVGVQLFIMAPLLGEPGFLDFAVYCALWVIVPAAMASAAHRIVNRP